MKTTKHGLVEITEIGNGDVQFRLGKKIAFGTYEDADTYAVVHGPTQHEVDSISAELDNPTPSPRRCTSCGAELGADWDLATVHIDREEGITCGGKIEG